jgi:hypothetical protein
VGSFHGSGSFIARGIVTDAAVDTWAGSGVFNAKALVPVNVRPFNYPPSWSIQINGPIIEGCGYDPITKNLKVWFTNTLGQFIILENLPYQITNAIEYAGNPPTPLTQEAYVLALIASTP